jgi:hypothetical protein
VSDVSYDELHHFASRLGVPRKAFQGDHYDLPERYLTVALEAGAKLVDPRTLLRSLKDAGLRRRPTVVADLSVDTTSESESDC